MGSEVAVAPREKPMGLVTFALATFNVTLALVAILLLAFRRDPELGERLSDLGTGAGLGLFALVWLAAVWATRGALRGARDPLATPFDMAMARGMLWGGRAGVLVFLALAAFVLTLALVRSTDDLAITEVVRDAPIALLYIAALGALGSAVAFVVGAAVGAVAACLDFAIVLLVRLALRVAE